MEFMLIGRDGRDENALDRRLAVRERHLALFDELSGLGHFKYGCVILDDEQKMTGSMIICQFSSVEEMEDLWLCREPYLPDVWKTVEITQIRSRVATA